MESKREMETMSKFSKMFFFICCLFADICELLFYQNGVFSEALDFDQN